MASKTSGSAEPDPRVIAALDQMKPYASAVAVVGLLGAPTEVLVPIIRRVAGCTGVSLGPGLLNLGHGLMALAAVRFFRQRPELAARWASKSVPRSALIAVPTYLLVTPAFAAIYLPAVVAPRRSPLWGQIVHPIGVLQVLLLTLSIVRARRARDRGVVPQPG